MKILRVIVDELPENCGECYFKELPNYWHCFVLDIGLLPEGEYRRHEGCPLRLEHDNKKIANEVM